MAFDHRDGAAAANPYAPLMGRTFVGLDETGHLTVIDPDRADTLSAWVGRIIPGDAEWPSASDLDTVAYIDAIIRKAPELRPLILAGIDAVEGSAQERHQRAFTALAAADQVEILREAELTTAREAFSVVLELVYEAYYRSARVQDVVKARTGFDVRNTVVGKPIEPFPTGRLVEISSRPDRYRSVPA